MDSFYNQFAELKNLYCNHHQYRRYKIILNLKKLENFTLVRSPEIEKAYFMKFDKLDAEFGLNTPERTYI